MRGVSPLLVLTYIACLIILAGCSGQEAELYNPFESRGSYAEVKGYTFGHQAGQVSTFQVTIRNNTQEQWQSEYYLMLLDREGVVVQFARRSFDLSPGVSFTAQIRAPFPINLSEGAYGLALMVPDRGSMTTTVWLGKEGQEAGPWPTITAPPS